MLKSDLTGQLPDSVHQVLTLAMDYLSDVVEVSFGLVVLPLDLVNLLLLDIELILLGREVLMQIDLDVLFGCQFLL